MKNIKKIFYESIVPEAMIGKVKAYFCYGVVFSTKIEELNKYYEAKLDNNDLVIPTLIIKDREKFDSLLTEYVKLALSFYDENNYMDEIRNYKMYDEKEMVCNEKLLLVNLFANATMDDFNDPISFLEKRIDFIKNYEDKDIDLGYADILNANLALSVTKDTLNNETPAKLMVRAYDDNEEFIFPEVKFGISGDTVYIYAIQNDALNNNSLSKKINRKLYKVGEGFIDDDREENPRDITASFLFVLNMAINYFNSIGYNKIVVPSFLIERWNAKKIATDNMYKKGRIDNNTRDYRNEMQNNIQSNLTNKLIRTFLRLGCHYNNIEIVSFPYESDASLHVNVHNDIMVKCNNKLLSQTGSMVNESVNKKIK